MKIKLSKKDVKKGLRLPKSINENVAYLSGVLAGDGSINVRVERYDYEIKCVGNPKDEKDLYFNVISPLFKKEFGIKLNPKYYDKGTTFGIRLWSKALVEYFTKVISLPKGKKYESLKIPLIFKKNKRFTIAFIRGLFDTDGCLNLKRGYQNNKSYPVIVGSSKSKSFMIEISNILKNLNFKVKEYFDYVKPDERVKEGFTIINNLELPGHKNLINWIKMIGFRSPKHLEKYKLWKLRNIGNIKLRTIGSTPN